MQPSLTFDTARKFIAPAYHYTDSQLQRVLDLFYALALSAYEHRHAERIDIPNKKEEDSIRS